MRFKNEKLVSLRKGRKWSQGDLQRTLHEETGVWVTRTAIAMWENGSVSYPRAVYVAAMARVFGVSMEVFFDHGPNRSDSVRRAESI
jgi:transcriptional regulator with XRE-family HTH domain